MAQQGNINVNGLSIPVWDMQSTAQQIDDTVNAVMEWQEDPDNPGCYYHMVDGVQEWINPPMKKGIEYRTIERYNGSPVYAYLSDVTGFGTPGTVTNTEISLGGSLKELLSSKVQLNGWNLPSVLYGGNAEPNNNVQVEIRVVTNGTIQVYLYTEARDLQGSTIQVFAKYTRNS